jgi:DHA3 family tetracycline resistance protein-like MFS transporter
LGILVAALLNGAALEMGSQAWMNTLQEGVPNELLERVSSVDMLSSTALLPVGFLLAGWATNTWGGATVCIMGGAITMLVGLLGFAHPAIWTLN